MLYYFVDADAMMPSAVYKSETFSPTIQNHKALFHRTKRETLRDRTSCTLHAPALCFVVIINLDALKVPFIDHRYYKIGYDTPILASKEVVAIFGEERKFNIYERDIRSLF